MNVNKGGKVAEITVFTSNGWGPCIATKSWLKKQGHEFIEYNISENIEHAEDLVRMGYRVTPVTIIDKETMIVGYNPQKLTEALE